MKIPQRFLVALGVWTIGILVVMLPLALMDDAAPASTHYISLIARAIGLAAFPAGISSAPAVFHRPRPWPELAMLLATMTIVSIVVLLLTTVLAPAISDQTRSVPQLIRDMTAAGNSWETRNDAAWLLLTSLFATVNTFLFAIIGLQVGAWGSRSLPLPLRRLLYWAAGLGLLISGFVVFDTTYETIVIHTNADVSFAAFYTILIPAGVCAGLMLPTFALFVRGEPARATD